MSETERRISRVNRLFPILILFYIGAALGLSWSGTLERLPANLNLVMGEILAAIPAALYCLLFREKPFGGRYGDRLRLPTALLLMALGVAVLPSVWFLNSLTSLFTTNYVAGAVVEMQANPLWLNLFLIAVVPAVAEETIFRGIFYEAYSRKNPIRGMVLSGLLFALLHLNLNQMAYALPLGILLAFVLEVTGSWAAPMILHFTINGVNTALSWTALRALDGMEITEAAMSEAAAGAALPLASYVVLFGMALVSLAVSAGLMWAAACSCRRKGWMRDLCRGRAPVLTAVDGVPVTRRVSDVFLWIGVAAALVYTLL